MTRQTTLFGLPPPPLKDVDKDRRKSRASNETECSVPAAPNRDADRMQEPQADAVMSDSATFAEDSQATLYSAESTTENEKVIDVEPHV